LAENTFRENYILTKKTAARQAYLPRRSHSFSSAASACTNKKTPLLAKDPTEAVTRTAPRIKYSEAVSLAVALTHSAAMLGNKTPHLRFNDVENIISFEADLSKNSFRISSKRNGNRLKDFLEL
jgi:hypothetical protein